MNISEILDAIRSPALRGKYCHAMNDANYRYIRSRLIARQVEAGRLARECPQCVLNPEYGKDNG